jgi:nitrogen regulatory protein PII
MDNQNLKALLIIINAGFASSVVDVAQESGSTGATIISARGSGAKFTAAMGIKYEPEREIVLSVVSEEVARKIMAKMKSEFGKNTPSNAVCFILPVERMTPFSR